jgi:hypothetical protein
MDIGSQASLTRVALPDDAVAGSLTEAFAARVRTLDGVRYSSHFSEVDLVPATLVFEAVIQNLIVWEPARCWCSPARWLCRLAYWPIALP